MQAYSRGARWFGRMFAVTMFASAALMFAIEPMVGKALLPAFGGGATVWTSVMLFFQIALLAGYALVHGASRRLGPKAGACILLGLGAAGGAMLPVVPHAVDAGMGPGIAVLATLCLGYGAAIVAMAGNAPSLQHWFGLRTGREPYKLYAVSNAGSLLGLALYPLVLERSLSLSEQGRLWRIAFGVCMASVAACALVAFLRPADRPSAPEAARPEQGTPAGPAPTAMRRLSWIGLSALPSSLLLGVTQHLTVNVAPLPFLWTLPLAVYLCTFIAAFSVTAQSVRKGSLFQTATMPLLVIMAVHPNVELNAPALDIMLQLLAFGSAALLCHGRLATLRPSADRLTEFYLYVSLGGVVGGLFNAIAAPLAFDRLLEYPLALAAALLIGGGAIRTGVRRRLEILPAVALAVALLAMSGRFGAAAAELLANRAASVAAVALVAAAAVATSRRGLAAFVAVGLVAPLYLLPGTHTAIVFSSRDFYGPLRVVERDGRRVLDHGTTVHGMQWLDPARSREPLLYYWPEAGIGRLFGVLKARRVDRAAPPLNVEAVGLGAGALACYGDQDTRLSFIEIDPGVASIAETIFTFLKDCRHPTVEIGDGRLLVEAKPPGSLDMIIMDAFSSDSVPAHLLTVDAVGHYRTKLAAGGAIAFHISNRYLDLAPVVASSAVANGMTALRYDLAPRSDDDLTGRAGSTWTAVTADGDLVQRLLHDGWQPIPAAPGGTVWTDDRWDLVGVLRHASN